MLEIRLREYNHFLGYSSIFRLKMLTATASRLIAEVKNVSVNKIVYVPSRY